MINESMLDATIQYLNRLVAADSEAIRKLIENRVECNDALANDPTCQVSSFEGSNRVGFLGVVNGMLGIHKDGWGALTAIFSDDEKILYGFRRTKIPGFEIAKESEIPADVKTQLILFMDGLPGESFTICVNRRGWYLFSLGLETSEHPLLVIPNN